MKCRKKSWRDEHEGKYSQHNFISSRLSLFLCSFCVHLDMCLAFYDFRCSCLQRKTFHRVPFINLNWHLRVFELLRNCFKGKWTAEFACRLAAIVLAGHKNDISIAILVEHRVLMFFGSGDGCRSCILLFFTCRRWFMAFLCWISAAQGAETVRDYDSWERQRNWGKTAARKVFML